MRVSILRILNEEYHQEGDDRRRGVDHELPGVRVAKDGTGRRPYDN